MDAEALYEDVVDGVHRRLRESLSDAARLDEIVVGWNQIAGRREDGQSLELVLVDPGREDGELGSLPRDAEVFETMRPGTLTDAFGRTVSAVGVPTGDRAEQLGRIVEKLVCLRADRPEVRDPQSAAGSG